MVNVTLAGVAFDKPDEFEVREAQVGLCHVVRLGVKDLRLEMNLMVGSVFDVAKAASPTKVSLHLPIGKNAGPSDVLTVANMLLAALEADASLESGGVIKNQSSQKGVTKKGLVFIGSSFFSGSNQDVVQGVSVIFEKDSERVAVVAYRGNVSLKDKLTAWHARIVDSLEFNAVKPLKRFRVNYYSTKSSSSYFESDSRWQYDVIDNKTGKVIDSFYESEYGSASGYSNSGAKNVRISDDETMIIVENHDGTVQNVSIAKSIKESERIEREMADSLRKSSVKKSKNPVSKK